MLRTCVVNCNSLLAIDIATYLVMCFCRRDGATSPVVWVAAYFHIQDVLNHKSLSLDPGSREDTGSRELCGSVCWLFAD